MGSYFVRENFLLKMKGRIYQSCVQSKMPYGSKTGCLKENEMAILRRTEKAMMREMCGVKITEKVRSQELMSLLGLKYTLDGLARASGVQWYGHVLRRALNFAMAERREHGQPNMTWKRQVEEHTNQIGLKKEDAIDRVK